MTEQRIDEVAYCGLHCGSCFSHEGRVADLARDLRKALRDCRFERTAETLGQISFFKEFNNYSTCYQVLGAMVKLRCGKTCRSGGGNPRCRIKQCSLRKGYSGCWECAEFKDCRKLSSVLEHNHGDAHIKNLRAIKKKGVDEFLDGKVHWFTPVKPSSQIPQD